jgi:metallo-beta-lactamase class B
MNQVRIRQFTVFQGYISRALACMISLCCAYPASAQMPETPGDDHPARTQRVEPFKIAGNIYFVGSRLHYPAYLLTTPEGHILIDTTFEEMVPDIVENIGKLGFKATDIKLMLASHAHHDHVGGHASMSEITGATVVSSAEDAKVIETGGKADFRSGDPWAPAKVDRIIEDLEKVSLGGTVLTMHLTPGHTRGCMTWTTQVEERGKTYDVVFLCGVRMNDREPLIGNPDYPDMARDFAHSIAILKTMPVDIYLGAHGYWFNIEEKVKRLKEGMGPNPFIDPDGYRDAIAYWEKLFLYRLKAERSK